MRVKLKSKDNKTKLTLTRKLKMEEDVFILEEQLNNLICNKNPSRNYILHETEPWKCDRIDLYGLLVLLITHDLSKYRVDAFNRSNKKDRSK